MRLSSFSYKTPEWELIKMSDIHPTSLLVGRNASGKTRVIKAIASVSQFIQEKKMTPFFINDFETKITLINDSNNTEKIFYYFKIKNNSVLAEKLTINGKTLISRNLNKVLFDGKTINPPSDKLAIQVRRDIDAYPDIEKIFKWAENVIIISCSNINPFTILYGIPSSINPFAFSDLVVRMSKREKEDIKRNSSLLGYNIQEIVNINVGEMKFVAIKEKNIKAPVLDFNLSSGMMRVIYILCLLKMIETEHKCNLLLIDDLGEGLDYNRATKLAELVFDCCKKYGVQLIASSNDSFQMDVVGLEDWQIMRRKNTKLYTLNNNNSTLLFKKFMLTGLSNFDLFASDFIEQYEDRLK